MQPDEYASYDGLGLAQLVRRGEVKAEELLAAALARAAQVNPSMNALILPRHDAARAELPRGLPDGPFRGVPFPAKVKGRISVHFGA